MRVRIELNYTYGLVVICFNDGDMLIEMAPDSAIELADWLQKGAALVNGAKRVQELPLKTWGRG